MALLNMESTFPLALLSKNVINPLLCAKGPPGSGGLKGEAGEMGPQVSVELGGAGGGKGGAASPAGEAAGQQGFSHPVPAGSRRVWEHVVGMEMSL